MNLPIIVREYGPPVPISLSSAQRTLLLNTGTVWKKTLGLADNPLVIEQTESTFMLRARQIAGVIKVGDVSIEIAPKFLDTTSKGNEHWRQAFWRILMVSGQDRAHFGRAHGSVTDTLSIADLLADVFLNAYARGSNRGMPLQYVEYRQTSNNPQGSFDHSSFGEWMVTPWRVPSVTDTLSANTPLSRLLSWAAVQLISLVRSVSSARALREMEQSLRGSGNVPSLLEAERITLGVQHDALRPALDVAILLLRGHGLNHGNGENDVIGFLWKTSDVYERFLYWLCQSAAKRAHLQVAKSATTFAISDVHRSLKTTPDVSFIKFDGLNYAVLDAKYKALNSAPKPEDSYQILTAAHALGCSHVGLVYPTGTERTEKKWRVSSKLGAADIQISALFIDLCLAAENSGIETLIQSISNWLSDIPIDARAHDLKGSATLPI